MKTFLDYKNNIIHAIDLINTESPVTPSDVIRWERSALTQCGLASAQYVKLVTRYGEEIRKLAESVLAKTISESDAIAQIKDFAKSTEIGNDVLNAREWPKLYQSKLIQPGIVNYDDIKLGNLYVDKDALDKIVPTFVLKPMVRRDDHKSGMTPADWERVAVGICTRVWWNSDDGWFWCEFAIWDDKANAEAADGFSVSCSYEPIDTGESGTHNSVPYKVRVFSGVGKHIAIVPNPRYDEAKIILVNSKGGKAMFNLFRKKGKDGKVSGAVSESDTLLIPGMKDRVTIKELMNAFEAANSEVREEVSEDATLKIGNKEYRIGDLVKSLENAKAFGKIKNDDGETDKGIDDKGENKNKEGVENEGESDEEKQGEEKKNSKGKRKGLHNEGEVEGEGEGEGDDKKPKEGEEKKNSKGKCIRNEGESDEDFAERKRSEEEKKNEKGGKPTGATMKNEGEGDDKDEGIKNDDGSDDKKDDLGNEDDKITEKDGKFGVKDSNGVYHWYSTREAAEGVDKDLRNSDGRKKFYELKNSAERRSGNNTQTPIPLETRNLRRSRGTLMFGSGNK